MNRTRQYSSPDAKRIASSASMRRGTFSHRFRTAILRSAPPCFLTFDCMSNETSRSNTSAPIYIRRWHRCSTMHWPACPLQCAMQHRMGNNRSNRKCRTLRLVLRLNEALVRMPRQLAEGRRMPPCNRRQSLNDIVVPSESHWQIVLRICHAACRYNASFCRSYPICHAHPGRCRRHSRRYQRHPVSSGRTPSDCRHAGANQLIRVAGLRFIRTIRPEWRGCGRRGNR
jgi:hypothetical protein